MVAVPLGPWGHGQEMAAGETSDTDLLTQKTKIK